MKKEYSNAELWRLNSLQERIWEKCTNPAEEQFEGNYGDISLRLIGVTTMLLSDFPGRGEIRPEFLARAYVYEAMRLLTNRHVATCIPSELDEKPWLEISAATRKTAFKEISDWIAHLKAEIDSLIVMPEDVVDGRRQGGLRRSADQLAQGAERLQESGKALESMGPWQTIEKALKELSVPPGTKKS